MSQVSGKPATANGRSTWRAVRPFLVLGGFVAVWWALTTGVAHADATPHGLGDTVRAAAKAHQGSPVRDVVRRVHHEAKPATTKVTTRVRHQAEPVTRTVSSAVNATPVAPVVAKTTETIRATVSDTVEKTRAKLTKTATGPVGDTVGSTVKRTASKPQSSTGQGNSPSERTSKKTSAASFAALLSATFGQQSTSYAATDQQRASIEADLPLDGPGGTPPVHDPCASPSGSSSTSFTPVGVTESSWLVLPSALRGLPTWCLARLPGGPAYQPGSSPD
jgi:hypothetical protein